MAKNNRETTAKNQSSKGGFQDNPHNINRKGRPPAETTWASVIDAASLEMAGTSGMTKKEAIAKVLIAKAGKGDLAAIKMIMDRVDGLCTAKIDHTTQGDKITQIERVIIDVSKQ